MFRSGILCVWLPQDHFVLRQAALDHSFTIRFRVLVGDANQAEPGKAPPVRARPMKAVLPVWCPRLVTLHVHSQTSFIRGILRMQDNLG